MTIAIDDMRLRRTRHAELLELLDAYCDDLYDEDASVSYVHRWREAEIVRLNSLNPGFAGFAAARCCWAPLVEVK